ncbi:MAG: pyruvate formate lyase family protein, partial [Promethearchaeota archaeon]
MNERIKKLRTQSREAIPFLSLERASLITEFYKTGAAHKFSAPIARAKAFQYILENKKICINEGELIVGERGSEPKATPTYPEVCCHSLQDLDILNSRDKISFKVSEETRKKTKDTIIPFWQGRSIRDKIFSQMDQDWIASYEAGVYTEFMEQRAPGHTAGGKNIWKKGFLDFKKEIKGYLDSLDFYNDPEAFNKREQLKAMDIAADAIIKFANRYSLELFRLSDIELDPTRKQELKKLAEICSNVPAHAPKTFWEALQHYWFIHLGVITEYNTWDAFNPGRLDQHLFPFYKNDVAKGILTKDKAIEL